MSETTFTEEERETIRKFNKNYAVYVSECVTSGKVPMERWEYLEATTEKSLTFPCPGCGKEMEESKRNEYHCVNLNCPITLIKAWDSMSKFDFSKALKRKK